MGAIIFSGSKVKTLKKDLLLGEAGVEYAKFMGRDGSYDPRVTTTDAEPGSLLVEKDTGRWFRKVDSGSSTNWERLTLRDIRQNYIDNGHFSVGTHGWTTYDDTGAFVDGTGGAPTAITLSRNTTTPLSGIADLQINKAAVSATGEGFSVLTSTIELADRGKELFLTFDYNFSAANYVSNDFKIHAYDVTNSVVLSVVPMNGVSNSSELQKTTTKGLVKISPSSTTASIRISFHIATDNASGSAYAVTMDRLSLATDSPTPGAIIGESTAFTPTGGWTTNTTKTGRYQRFGDKARIEYFISLSGAPNAVPLVLDLPTGLTIDTAKLLSTGGTNSLDSNGAILDSGSYVGVAKVNYSTATQVEVRSLNTVTPYVMTAVTATAPIVFAAGDQIYLCLEVPIVGWLTSTLVSNIDLASKTVRARGYRSSSQAIAASTPVVVAFNAESYDTHGAFNTANGVFTAPSTGYYGITASIQVSSYANAEELLCQIRRNGANIASLQFPSGGTVRAINPSTHVLLTAGDTVDVTIDSSADTSYTVDAGETISHISIVQFPDMTVFGLYGIADYKAATSSLKNPGVLGSYQNMSGNSVVLSPGVWILHGAIEYSSSGGVAHYYEVFGAWSTANGADTAAVPAALSVQAGWQGTFGRKVTPFDASNTTSCEGTVRVLIATTTTVFLVPFMDANTAPNTRIRTYIHAERVQ